MGLGTMNEGKESGMYKSSKGWIPAQKQWLDDVQVNITFKFRLLIWAAIIITIIVCEVGLFIKIIKGVFWSRLSRRQVLPLENSLAALLIFSNLWMDCAVLIADKIKPLDATPQLSSLKVTETVDPLLVLTMTVFRRVGHFSLAAAIISMVMTPLWTNVRACLT